MPSGLWWLILASSIAPGNKENSSGDQPSWLVGLDSPGPGTHQPTPPDPATEAQAPPFPQALTHLQALNTGSQLAPYQPIYWWWDNISDPQVPLREGTGPRPLFASLPQAHACWRRAKPLSALWQLRGGHQEPIRWRPSARNICTERPSRGAGAGAKCGRLNEGPEWGGWERGVPVPSLLHHSEAACPCTGHGTPCSFFHEQRLFGGVHGTEFRWLTAFEVQQAWV